MGLPLQITPEEPKRGLRYAAVEVPAGVRGRMAIYGPLIEEAEAAVIVTDADLAFGCMGCARTDELILFSLRQSGIPILELKYPTNDEEGVEFVAAIKKFLAGLDDGGEA